MYGLVLSPNARGSPRTAPPGFESRRARTYHSLLPGQRGVSQLDAPRPTWRWHVASRLRLPTPFGFWNLQCGSFRSG